MKRKSVLQIRVLPFLLSAGLTLCFPAYLSRQPPALVHAEEIQQSMSPEIQEIEDVRPLNEPTVEEIQESQSSSCSEDESGPGDPETENALLAASDHEDVNLQVSMETYEAIGETIASSLEEEPDRPSGEGFLDDGLAGSAQTSIEFTAEDTTVPLEHASSLPEDASDASFPESFDAEKKSIMDEDQEQDPEPQTSSLPDPQAEEEQTSPSDENSKETNASGDETGPFIDKAEDSSLIAPMKAAGPQKAPAAADTVWQEDYTYSLDDASKTISLLQYNGSSTELSIPASAVLAGQSYSTILGETVQDDGTKYGPFSHTNVQSLSFEDGVATTNNHLFYNAASLSALNLSGLRYPEGILFSGLPALRTLTTGTIPMVLPQPSGSTAGKAFKNWSDDSGTTYHMGQTISQSVTLHANFMDAPYIGKSSGNGSESYIYDETGLEKIICLNEEKAYPENTSFGWLSADEYDYLSASQKSLLTAVLAFQGQTTQDILTSVVEYIAKPGSVSLSSEALDYYRYAQEHESSANNDYQLYIYISSDTFFQNMLGLKRGAVPGTGSLNLHKTVQTGGNFDTHYQKTTGYALTGPFTIRVKLTDNAGNPLKGTFPVQDNNAGTLTDSFSTDGEGFGELRMMRDDDVTITGIPAGTIYSIEETEDSFFCSHSISNQTGTIHQGTIASAKITNLPNFGSLILTKQVAGDEPTTGAKYRFTVSFDYREQPLQSVYCLLNGDSKGARKLTDGSWSFTLSADDTVEFNFLPAGTMYSITEQTVSDMNGLHCTTTIQGESSGTITRVEVPYEVTFINTFTPIEGNLTLTKTDVTGDALLAGAVYGIYSDASASTLVQQVTTGENGSVSVSLLYGTYYLKELTAPEGYALDSSIHGPYEISASSTPSPVLTDTPIPKGVFNLEKTDKLTGRAVANAVYGLYTENTCQNLVQKLTTGTDGTVRISLDDGTYYLKELEAPARYQLDVSVYGPYSITAGGQVTEKLTDLPIPDGKLTISKTDQLSGKMLPDAVYGVYFDASCTNLVQKLTTGSDGTVSISLKDGTYYLKELAAPDRYRLDPTVYGPYNVGYGEQLTVDLTDQPIPNGKLTINKTDQLTGQVVADAVYGIYTDENCTVLKQTVTTGAEGSVSVSLEDGTYYLKETEAPPRYQLDSHIYGPYTVHPGKTTSVSLTDMPVPDGILQLTKTDITTGAALSGAIYGIYTDVNCQTLVQSITTNERGTASISLADGVYYVKEITAPRDYQTDEKIYGPYTVTYGHTVPVAVTDTLIPNGNLFLTKTDFDSKKALGGAVYGIYTDAACTVLVQELTTNDQGTASVSLDSGSYYLREITAPRDYQLDTDIHGPFTIERGTTTSVSLTDLLIPDGSLELTKTDLYTHSKLSGAVYGIYADADGSTLVTKVTTDEEGHASASLKAGTYYLKELAAPVGYQKDFRIHGPYQVTSANPTSADLTDIPKVIVPTGLYLPHENLSVCLLALVFGSFLLRRRRQDPV